MNAGRAPDLVMSTHAAVVVYRVGRGTMHRMFYRAGDDPHGCAIADVDANGLGDVYCSRGADYGTLRKRNHLWLQARAGDFVERAGAWGVTDPYGRGRHVVFLELDGDGRPDLFVGNEHPRANGRPSPNRTFVNVGGERFRQVRIGATAEVGARCAQCRRTTTAMAGTTCSCAASGRLYLYRNTRDREGDRRLVDVARPAWRSTCRGRPRRLARRPERRRGRRPGARPSRDGSRCAPGRGDGTFRRPVLDLAVAGRSSVAVGDLDGRRGPDLVLVRGCARREQPRRRGAPRPRRVGVRPRPAARAAERGAVTSRRRSTSTGTARTRS